MVKELIEWHRKAATDAGYSFRCDYLVDLNSDNEAQYPLVCLIPPQKSGGTRDGKRHFYRCEFYIFEVDVTKGKKYTALERETIWNTQESNAIAMRATLLGNNLIANANGFTHNPGYGMLDVSDIHTGVTYELNVSCGISSPT